MNISIALQLVEDIKHDVVPVTDQLLVVGAVRREDEVINEIEMLVVPALEEIDEQQSMFIGMAQTYHKNLFVNWYMQLPTLGLLSGVECDVVLSSSSSPWFASALPPTPPPHPMLVGYSVVAQYQTPEHPTPLPVTFYVLDHQEQWGIGAILSTGNSKIADRYTRMVVMKSFSVWNLALHEHPERTFRSGPCDPLKCPKFVDTDTEKKAYAAIGLPYVEPSERTHENMKELEKESLGLSTNARWP